MIPIDYYDYQKKNISDRIKKEMDLLKKSPHMAYSALHKAYYSYLKLRINYETSGNVKMKNITKLEELKPSIQGDIQKTLYDKPWHRLKETHKLIKFREFVEKLEYKKPNLKNKAKVLKELLYGLKEKRYGQSKVQVEYDQDKMEIVSVQCLSYSKKRNMWIVTWE